MLVSIKLQVQAILDKKGNYLGLFGLCYDPVVYQLFLRKKKGRERPKGIL